jgi:hypothetical protein
MADAGGSGSATTTAGSTAASDTGPAANIQGQIHISRNLRNFSVRYGDGKQYPRKRTKPRDNWAVGKAEPRTLYVSRPVLNGGDLVDWAKSEGFATALQPNDLHVTLAFSRTPLDWSKLLPLATITQATNGERAIERFGPEGEKKAAVLKFAAPELEARWQQLCDAGASWDWPNYKPHVTISWDAPDGIEDRAKPYTGPIIFGPEKFAEVEDDWHDSIVEKAMQLDDVLAELEKKLGSDATAADYIHDFVHSANPKFKGKSKEERIQMALGAFYGKRYQDDLDAELAKIGARHSSTDRDLIQTMHDNAVTLGADCGNWPSRPHDYITGPREQPHAGDTDMGKFRLSKVEKELGIIIRYGMICNTAWVS